jgi:hypothetical protein
LDRDRVTFLQNRLSVFTRLYTFIQNEVGDILQLLTECHMICDPKVSSEKWVANFSRQGSRMDPTLEAIRSQMAWPLSTSADDLQSIVLAFSVDDQNPNSEEMKAKSFDDEWDDVNISLTEEDFCDVFLQAKATVSAEADGCLRVTKGDVLKLLRPAKKEDDFYYCAVLSSSLPLAEGLISKNNVDVLLPSEDMPFAQCMHLPGGISFFTEYLKSEHSEEHVIFWTCVNQFYISNDTEAGKGILETFVNSGAPFQINIPFTLRDKILKQVQTNGIHRDIFKEAQAEVYSVLRNDNFRRFRSSTLFTRKFLPLLTKRINPVALEMSGWTASQ